ncbi:MAG: Methyltransferase type 11, partial [Neobacillus sp.]|nr:Methyltransferase type 11 [Neobacillus sp.]
YESSDEDSRLTTDNARRIEFLLTTRVLDNYIKPNQNILELGAGTGVYSFYYAENMFNVVATDITPKHIAQINQKLIHKDSPKLNLEAKIVDATNLMEFDSDSFDVVLCLGPMYHLTNEKLRKDCIQESLRVLKKGGLLAIAYINKHYILHSVMTSDKKYLSKEFVTKIMETGVIREGEGDCFWTDAFFTSPDEMEIFLKKFDIQIMDHLATDGFSPFLRDFISGLNDEELNAWIYYIEKSCKEKSILGISNHAIVICQKGV